MHNKFCVIDDEILITGSFNWSRSAEFHFENVIVLKHAYKAIKEYLHEFNELIDYYHESVNFPRYEPCLESSDYNVRCRSRSYYIGLLGQEFGRHNESETEVWRVCNAEQRHTEFVTSFSEHFLMSTLGLTSDDFDYDHGEYYDKQTMLDEIRRERNRSRKIFDYFEHSRNVKVQAIGFLTTADPVSKYDDGPYDQEIRIVWRNPYYRKIVPSVFHDDGSIDQILERLRSN